MEEKNFYNVYSQYLKDKYGEKVYKLPINLPLTCPNLDGNQGHGGCTFCGEEGGSFENLSNTLSIKSQIKENMEYIRKRYKAKKFIAYFQNFSNTYLALEKFKENILESIVDDIVGISISTRPDCINDDYLIFLREVKEKYSIDITIELGLQTVNYHSLKKINRGHSLGEFIDGVLRIKENNLRVCTHLILNLPWDNDIDVIENAKVLSSLKVDEVKLHSLYIVKNTELGKSFENNEFEMISKEEYIERVILFLEYLDPGIIIQRVIGRAPEENTLFVNWQESWWKIRDQILENMQRTQSYQGKRFNYLNGKAVKKLN